MKYTKRETLTADKWSAVKEDLAELAAEQVRADIEAVEASRALKAAQERYDSAIKRRTSAEKKLAAARANLGGE